MSDVGTNYDEFLARLKGVRARFDAVPERVRETARASQTWVSVDAELAELVFDSVVDTELVSVRGSGGGRQLTFEGPELVVEVQVGDTPGRISGQVAPPQETEIEVHHSRGSFTVRSDTLGHFRVDGVPEGLVSLQCRRGSATPMTRTEWVVI